MAEMKGKSKRLPINLSFLTLTHSMKQIKSPRNFEEPNGVVGLGILAALNDDHHHNHALISNNGSRTTVLVLSPKSASSPIPIRNNFVSENDSYNKLVSAEKLDFCEGYTCVMSHVGKTEYFEAEIFGNNNVPPIVSVVFGTDVFGSPVTCGGETVAIGVADFLSACFLCEKMLHGLDVFMYRGEKAFCSTECRRTQISVDEKKEKRRSGVRRSLKYSVSPCSVAAA